MPTVRVTAFESVVPRGTRRVDWLVQQDKSWCNVADVVCGNVLPSEDRGPQLIWQRLVAVTVPIGTWFQRIVTEPGAEVRRDPLAYLQRAPRGVSKRVQRTYYRANANGTLTRADGPPEAEDA